MKDLASICKSTFYMDVLLLSNIRNLGNNLERKLIFDDEGNNGIVTALKH